VPRRNQNPQRARRKKLGLVRERKIRDHAKYIATRHGTFENRIRNCLYNRRKIAKAKGIEFALELENFTEITHCPLLPQVKLRFDATPSEKDDAPSIDRLDPSKGYTTDNVWVISHRANRIKSDATLEELETICRNWRLELERRGLI
jgi:hypothetical protein